ncbi:MAG: glycosyltransferase [Cyanobium sp.]|jgi:glycosyltransferase involved in cell wall biosynthesis
MPTTTLFVCHEGQRTGAPLQLLWLIRWLIANTTIQPQVALMRDGPLRQEFAALCPTHTFTRPIAESWRRRLRRRFDPSLNPDPDTWLAALVDRLNPDCLYLNTLVLGYCLGTLRLDRRRTRVISHVHELEIGLMISSTQENVARQLALSDTVVCCADVVKHNLISQHQVEPSRCLVVPVFLPFQAPVELETLRCHDQPSQQVIDTLRRHRQEGCFLFGFAGSPIDRKGFDLFPQLVQRYASHYDQVPFKAVWVGCAPGSLGYVKADRDLRLLGVREHALLLPGVSCGAAALAELDALMLLSREDPYPVVALEAGALGIATVCFRHSGGIASLAEEGYGLAVDYLDLEAFAAALEQLRTDPAGRRSLGERFSQRVFAVNTVAVQGARIASLINGDVPAGSAA